MSKIINKFKLMSSFYLFPKTFKNQEYLQNVSCYKTFPYKRYPKKSFNAGIKESYNKNAFYMLG